MTIWIFCSKIGLENYAELKDKAALKVLGGTMRGHLKFAGKCAAFVCILCICIRLVYQVIVPKFFFDDTWPTTTTYLGFYKMKEDTIDVLFLGSSHAVSSFIPQELYNGYGITSYNLACEQQSLVTSYFWLKEALSYQKPRAVVLDCHMLFRFRSKEALNSTEACTRKAMDCMRWSSVKREAVKTICELDKNQSLLSYYFPNIRYHTRWAKLQENDFVFGDMAKHNELKGYAPLTGGNEREDFTPFESGIDEGWEDMLPLMREYLDHIVELCEQEKIALILVKTPTVGHSIGKFYAIQSYADEHGLPFFDFNERKLYDESGFCYMTDSVVDDHVNFRGARKITDYIGRMLAGRYGLGGSVDRQWEDTRAYYENTKKDSELLYVTDVDEYLDMLQDERYSIFISVKNDCTSDLRTSTIQKLRELGLEAELSGEFRCSYLAMISDGEILEEIGYDKLEASGTVRDSLVTYDIVSAGYGCGNLSSIVIDGFENSQNSSGLNIVVYNNETKKRVDSVCFDTQEGNHSVIR